MWGKTCWGRKVLVLFREYHISVMISHPEVRRSSAECCIVHGLIQDAGWSPVINDNNPPLQIIILTKLIK